MKSILLTVILACFLVGCSSKGVEAPKDTTPVQQVVKDTRSGRTPDAAKNRRPQ